MNQPIKSFIVRRKRLTPGQKRAVSKLWLNYTLNPELNDFDLEQIFQRQNKKILEVGFGNGESLLQMALNHPEYDYIGIEVHMSGVGCLLANLEKYQVTNVRIFVGDAVEILTKIKSESLDCIQIFFPDPWPKTRHRKRRLIKSEFVSLLLSKLKMHGILYLATDDDDYAKHMLNVLSAENSLLNLAGEGQFSPRLESRPITKYELRGLKLGHKIWDLRFRKVLSPYTRKKVLRA